MGNRMSAEMCKDCGILLRLGIACYCCKGCLASSLGCHVFITYPLFKRIRINLMYSHYLCLIMFYNLICFIYLRLIIFYQRIEINCFSRMMFMLFMVGFLIVIYSTLVLILYSYYKFDYLF